MQNGIFQLRLTVDPLAFGHLGTELFTKCKILEFMESPTVLVVLGRIGFANVVRSGLTIHNRFCDVGNVGPIALACWGDFALGIKLVLLLLRIVLVFTGVTAGDLPITETNTKELGELFDFGFHFPSVFDFVITVDVESARSGTRLPGTMEIRPMVLGGHGLEKINHFGELAFFHPKDDLVSADRHAACAPLKLFCVGPLRTRRNSVRTESLIIDL